MTLTRHTLLYEIGSKLFDADYCVLFLIFIVWVFALGRELGLVDQALGKNTRLSRIVIVRLFTKVCHSELI